MWRSLQYGARLNSSERVFFTFKLCLALIYESKQAYSAEFVSITSEKVFLVVRQYLLKAELWMSNGLRL